MSELRNNTSSCSDECKIYDEKYSLHINDNVIELSRYKGNFHGKENMSSAQGYIVIKGGQEGFFLVTHTLETMSDCRGSTYLHSYNIQKIMTDKSLQDIALLNAIFVPSFIDYRYEKNEIKETLVPDAVFLEYQAANTNTSVFCTLDKNEQTPDNTNPAYITYVTFVKNDLLHPYYFKQGYTRDEGKKRLIQRILSEKANTL